MSWGGRCSLVALARSPNRNFPKAPAPPVRGFLFGRSTKKPGLTWPGFPLRSGTQSGACSPELRVPVPPNYARKSMVGEFARMAGLGRQIGRLEIMIERCLKATVGGEWGTKTRTLGMSFGNDSVLHSGGSIQLWWSFPVHSNSQKRSPDPAPTGRRLFVPTPDSTGGNERGDAQSLRI